MKYRDLLITLPTMMWHGSLIVITCPLTTFAKEDQSSSVGLFRGSHVNTVEADDGGFPIEEFRNLDEMYNTTNKTITNDMTKELRDAIVLENILYHLEVLDYIANNQTDDKNRAAGTIGYDLSRDYVYDQLKQVGYDVQLQEFSFNYWSLSNAQMPGFSSKGSLPSSNIAYYPVGEEGEEEGFSVIEYSGSGDIENALIQGVDLQLPPGNDANNSTSGCEPEDFDTFDAGRVALIQRGTCAFNTKVQNAMDAGAIGVIIFNEGQEGRTGVLALTLSGKLDNIENFPVIFTSFNIGNDLAQAAALDDLLTVNIFVDAIFDERVTDNIIAETKTGNENATVVVGAHLDSVIDGAGINDNGSGSTAILETAIQMAKLNMELENKIQFVWFGAEEVGLYGSAYFVDEYIVQLEQGINNQTIALMLNVDTIANTNGIRNIASADDYPTGSKQAANIMMDYCDEESLPYIEDPDYFVCQTDSCYFLLSDIPIAAIGSGDPFYFKTQEEVETYGGTVDEPLDACVHLECDNITNINEQYLDENTDIIAHTVVTLGLQYDLMTFLYGESYYEESLFRRNLDQQLSFDSDKFNIIPSMNGDAGVYTM